MESQLVEILSGLARAGAQHDVGEGTHSRRLLNLEPETARLLALLARSAGATRVLEIGTSNGYSTIWLAWAVSPAGGRVTTIERSADKQSMARANLARCGYLDRVDLLVGDATAIIADLSGPFDLVFFDADRLSATEQLRLLVPKLADRVLLLADNVLSHPTQIAGYLRAVTELDGFEHTVVPVGKGLSIACSSGISQK